MHKNVITLPNILIAQNTVKTTISILHVSFYTLSESCYDKKEYIHNPKKQV